MTYTLNSSNEKRKFVKIDPYSVDWLQMMISLVFNSSVFLQSSFSSQETSKARKWLKDFQMLIQNTHTSTCTDRKSTIHIHVGKRDRGRLKRAAHWWDPSAYSLHIPNTDSITHTGNDPVQMYMKTLPRVNRCGHKTCLCVCELQSQQSVYCVRGLVRLHANSQLTAPATATLSYYRCENAIWPEKKRNTWGERRVNRW